MGCGNIRTKDDEETNQKYNNNNNNNKNNHVILANLNENNDDFEKYKNKSSKNITNYSLNENINNNKNNTDNQKDNKSNYNIIYNNNNQIHHRMNEDYNNDLSRLNNLSSSSSMSNLDNTNVSFLNSSNLVTMSNIFSSESSTNINNNNNNNIVITSDNKKNNLQVTVDAIKFETLYPIWIEKNNIITFEVSGKWFIEKYKECDCNGLILSNNLSDLNEFNDGALIGRILGGKNFAIFNGLKYKSEFSGPLFMKMNVYNCFNKKSQPYGSLNVIISGSGVYEKSFEEIEKSFFWDKLKFFNDNNIPKFEKEIIININKIRCNSKLYAMMYLEDVKWFNNKTKQVYNELVNKKKKLNIFKVNKNLIDNIKKFYVNLLQKNTKKKKKKILESGSDLKEFLNNIYFNNNKNFNNDFFKVIISVHDSLKVNGICVKLLLDDIMRKEILNEENEFISVLTMKTTKLNKITLFSIFVFNNKFDNIIDNFHDKIHIKKLNRNLDIIKEEDILQSNEPDYNFSNGIFNDNYENTNENIDKKEISEYDKIFRTNTYNSNVNITEEDKHINFTFNNVVNEEKNDVENNDNKNIKKLEINVNNINNCNNFIKIEHINENKDNNNDNNNNNNEDINNKEENNSNNLINNNDDNIDKNKEENNSNNLINNNDDNIDKNKEENISNKIINNNDDKIDQNKDINNNNNNNENNININNDNNENIIIENKEKSIVIENNDEKIKKEENDNNNDNKKINKLKLQENETDINIENTKRINDDNENNNIKND